MITTSGLKFRKIYRKIMHSDEASNILTKYTDAGNAYGSIRLDQLSVCQREFSPISIQKFRI